MQPSAAPGILATLLGLDDPVVQYKVRTLLLGEEEASPGMRRLHRRIASSAIVRALLTGRGSDGRIDQHPYRKWQGPHWTLCCLAQVDYPPGDASLLPLRDQMYDYLFDPSHLESPRSLLIPGQEDRFRRCASQEGNAIWYSLLLGIDDERTGELVRRLVRWQWPDGGWNCDKRPAARTSSVIESLIPLRALGLAARRLRGDLGGLAGRAAARAAEFFLQRGLFRRLRDGTAITKDFARIHYPIQFYDVLFVLQIMAELGRLGDPRCREALNLLRAKQLPDGGFPLELPTARTSRIVVTRGTWADWGPSGRRRTNPLVTVEALRILGSA